MRILHAYCLNYNIGDYALGIGVKNLLREYLQVDYIAETNIQGQYFDEYYINEVVNKRYDLLVIGGGGLIHGAHWPNGWFWLIEKELIQTIKIPFLVYGIGNNYFENEVIPEKAVLHLRETEQRAEFFSVRNDGSFKRIVEQVGVSPFVVPDPGFHLGLNSFYKRRIEKPYVIVQVANDKVDQRFKASGSEDYFVESMRNVIEFLSEKYLVILAPHVFSDVELSEKISKGITNVRIWDFSYLAFDHTTEALDYYYYAEFVIAMRGHGQIIPLGFNVPVIALNNHPKHVGLMTELGLEEFTISIHEANFDKSLINLITFLLYDFDKLKNRLVSINQKMKKDTELAFSIINKRLNK